MPALNRRQFYPTQQQLALPGLAAEAPEQMRLFDTHRAGPANVYAANPAADASQWQDRDRTVPVTEDEHAIIEDEDYALRGEFSTFPIGREDREFIAYGGAHQRAFQQSRDDGTYLGHDAYPAKTNPDVQFSDLQHDDYEDTQWWTDGGTLVGEVAWHEDEWGPYVNTAEINPMYRGRGFTREAIPDFARRRAEDTPGIVHAGSYTEDGTRAFHAKGIPTTSDIEEGYDAYVDDMDIEPDTESLVEMLADSEVGSDRGWDWNAPESEWSREQETAFSEEYDRAVEDERENFRYEGYAREDYRESLEAMQEQVLANLPSSRTGQFAAGWAGPWKPKGPASGRNEKLPGMP